MIEDFYNNLTGSGNGAYITSLIVLACVAASVAILSVLPRVQLAVGFYSKKGPATPEPQGTKTLLAAIIECSDDAIISENMDGVITSWNAAAEHLFGYAAAEAIGQMSTLIVPPERHPEENHILDCLRQGQRIEHFETVRLTKQGRPVDISLTVSALRDGAGNIEGTSRVARDITPRKRMEEALKESEKKLYQVQKMEAVSKFTGGMAHNFNNLLSIIIGNLDLLVDRLKDRGEVEQLTQVALDAALRGADLTERLLTFAHQQPLQPQYVEINPLLERTGKLLGHMLGEDIRVVFDFAADAWPVVVDEARLEASLTNLATNAREAMPGGGQLTIAAYNCHLDAEYVRHHPEAAIGDYTVIEVSDTGSGMRQDIVEHVFEPFFTTKEHGKGTGLGLSMVAGFVRQSGGHVDVCSEVDAGTTVRLYLPKGVAEIVPAIQPQQYFDSRGHETVLVVEDNNAVRNIVARQLGDLGYNVVEARSASAALELLESEISVNLLFTDIVMLGAFNGLDLARLATERWPSLKVVLTSGFPQAKINGYGDPAAGMRLLTKPYRKHDLSRLLREVFDSDQPVQKMAAGE